MKINVEGIAAFDREIIVNDEFIRYLKFEAGRIASQLQSEYRQYTELGEDEKANIARQNAKRLLIFRGFSQEDIENSIKITLGDKSGGILIDSLKDFIRLSIKKFTIGYIPYDESCIVNFYRMECAEQ